MVYKVIAHTTYMVEADSFEDAVKRAMADDYLESVTEFPDVDPQFANAEIEERLDPDEYLLREV